MTKKHPDAGFLNFCHDGSITITNDDGSHTVLNANTADILGEAVAGCWMDYVERNRGKPFVPMKYTQPIPDSNGVWFEAGEQDHESILSQTMFR